MSRDEIRAGVVAELTAIAPEIEEGDLTDSDLLRDQVDLDSMDWLNVIVGLHQRFGIDVPETDYARLGTLDAIVAYIADRLAASARDAGA